MSAMSVAHVYPRHAPSSGHRWRYTPDEGSCRYIERAAADSRLKVVRQLGGWAGGLTTFVFNNKPVAIG
jgi:hypothetical protein